MPRRGKGYSDDISQEGRDKLSELLEAARDRMGFNNWEEFAEYLSEQTGLTIKKDALYNAASQRNVTTPSAKVIYALVQLGLLIDNNIKLNTDQVFDILYSKTDPSKQ